MKYSNKNTIKITTDNEWIGKYEILEEQYNNEKIEIFSLGDNLPTERRSKFGKASIFKTTLKELAKQYPEITKINLMQQLEIVHKLRTKDFEKVYFKAPEIISQSAKFLKNSSLPVITAITGNREFDYQTLLDFVAKKTNSEQISYLDKLTEAEKFDLITNPKLIERNSTGIILLPYNKKTKTETIDEVLDSASEGKYERLILMTHENPIPTLFGVDRKVKMKEELNYCIENIVKINQNSTAYTGHLDKSNHSIIYLGVKIQPISGTEAGYLNTDSGLFEKINLIKND